MSAPSIDDHEEWLPFLDDVRGELRRVAGADVLHSVDRLRRDHQRIAGVVSRLRLTVDRILGRPLEDVRDLFARMLWLKAGASGRSSMRFGITTRPGRLRSCSWRSMRLSPGTY